MNCVVAFALTVLAARSDREPRSSARWWRYELANGSGHCSEKKETCLMNLHQERTDEHSASCRQDETE